MNKDETYGRQLLEEKYPALAAVPQSTFEASMPTEEVTAEAAPPAAALENPDKVILTLHRPITVNGKTLTEITLDFSRYSGDMMENIEDEMREAGRIVPQNMALSVVYGMYVVARVAGLNYGDMRRMHGKDVTRLVQAAQNFILVSD